MKNQTRLAVLLSAKENSAVSSRGVSNVKPSPLSASSGRRMSVSAAKSSVTAAGVERPGGFFLPRCRLCGKRLGGRCSLLRLIQGVRCSDHGLSAARAQRQQQGQGSAQYQQIFFIIFLPVFLLERLCQSEAFRFHSLLRSCRAAFRSGVLQSTGRVRWSRGPNRRCKSGRTGARPPRG